MNDQDIVAASQRVVELSTQRELTEAEQSELQALREQLVDQPNLDGSSEGFVNPLITKSDLLES